jgi:hypothetical protein
MITYKKIALSLILVGLLSAQILASFGFIHERYWPFVNYPMYMKPHYPGEVISRMRLVGITTEGREVPMTVENFRYNFFQFLYGPLRAIQRQDRIALDRHVRWYEKRNGVTLAALRLENHPVGRVEGKVAELPTIVTARINLRDRP